MWCSTTNYYVSQQPPEDVVNLRTRLNEVGSRNQRALLNRSPSVSPSVDLTSSADIIDLTYDTNAYEMKRHNTIMGMYSE